MNPRGNPLGSQEGGLGMEREPTSQERAKGTGNKDEFSFAAPLEDSLPSITYPKSGGSIASMGEKFTTNPSLGTGTLQIPISISKGRRGGEPQLSLSYNTGSGNGPFGLGWSLGIGAITRKTDKGLPRYRDDTEEEDTFILSGAEDLVPELSRSPSGSWEREQETTRMLNGIIYSIRHYIPRTEGLFASIEKWTSVASRQTHWRVVSSQNVISVYGSNNASRIFDPEDPTKVFSWLLSSVRGDRGGEYVFEYKREDSTGVDTSQSCERNRSPKGRAVNLYPKRVKYGNRVSTLAADQSNGGWLFEVVFDYGEHDAKAPTSTDTGDWICRNDPFSTYRSGFEVRTYRLCQRILIFHHFPEERNVGADCLVKSYDLRYRNIRNQPLDESRGHPIASFLAKFQCKGYVRSNDGYTQASLPPLELYYTGAVVSDEIHDFDATSLDNLPNGLDGKVAELVDMDGEGISGVLTQHANAWYYKPPLGDAKYGPMYPIPLKPNIATLTSTDSKQMLIDLDGDGMLEVVQVDRGKAGYSERTWTDNIAGWSTFRNFVSLPNLDWSDTNIRFLDLTGDGLPDVLMTENEVFSWYPSLSKDGFGSMQRQPKALDEEKGPRLVFSDVLHSVFTADMSGDGLSDLVRVTSTEVCYWPNLGYGNFGAKITISNSPLFDFYKEWDPLRVRLGDVDGSGTTDLVYLGTKGAQLYLNQSGNSWSDAILLKSFPAANSIDNVKLADLLGNGTSCLIWSTRSAGNRPSVQYLDLTSGKKPHLLASVVNNMGSETRISYNSSTHFCLEDKLAGKPWITRLPFPVQVVERVDAFDRVSRTFHTSKYSYHHGHYDGFERELIGFGLVEQWDTEEFAAMKDSQSVNWDVPAQNLNEESHVPPVYTKTWFHLGIWLNDNKISKTFENEHWQEPGTFTAAEKVSMTIGGTSLPTGLRLQDGTEIVYKLNPQELREACRALRGSVLRQETYALDDSTARQRPYMVSEANFSISLLQPLVQGSKHAVFMTHPKETVDIEYERVLVTQGGKSIADPRTSHNIILDTDYWGNVLKSVSVAYGRRQTSATNLTAPEDIEKQTKTMITYQELEYTNAVIDSDARRLPQNCESRLYELVKIQVDRFKPSLTALFTIQEIRAKLGQASDGRHDLAHDDVDAAGAVNDEPYRRLLEQARLLFRKDDLTGSLPLKQVQSMALPYQGQQMVVTPDMLRKNLVEKGKTTAAELDVIMANEVRYIHSEGDPNWWTFTGLSFYSPGSLDSPSQELEYAKSHFFVPCRTRDQFHSDTFKTETLVTYDRYDLLAIETLDAFGNRDTVGLRNADPTKPLDKVGIDYRVLAPVIQMDANRNQQATAYNALGMVVGTAVMGKPEERLGDSLDDFIADITSDDVQKYLSDPLTYGGALLGGATTRVVYDSYAYQRSSTSNNPQPCVLASLSREIHTRDLAAGQVSPVQHRLSYLDGLGRGIQTKSQVEQGLVPLRDPQSGRVIISDGKPVMTTSPVSPRWVGSGWTVLNNKGNPVRQFEPFFTDRVAFEFDVRIGFSSTIMYDPLGRVVATLSADHTWRKTKFSPWREEGWDANDTLSIPDPALDDDMGGYFSRLESSMYSPTWYSARQAGQLGPSEQRAAENAFVHSNTPNVSHLDSLGRRFLVVTHNKSKTSDMAPSDPPKEEFFTNRIIFDIQGNYLRLIDAWNRTAGAATFNMLGRPILQQTMDSGEQYCLDDVAGRSIYIWDSRGNRFRHTFDQNQRPNQVYLKTADAAEILMEHAVYGESAPEPEKSNVRGRTIQFFDSAGVTKTLLYDFKGNLLAREQTLVKDYKTTIDWNMAVDLEDQTFMSNSSFNALNLPLTAVAPDKSIIHPTFDKANRFKAIDVNIRGSTTATNFISNIDYNAKSQRTLIDYGNGVRSTFAFDDLNSRLLDLVTRRKAQSFPDDCPQPPVPAWPGCQVQSLHYNYDAVGNIASTRDDAQQRVYFDNKKVDPSNDYIYDAVYRLIEATGREHLGLTNGNPSSPTAPDASDLFHSRLAHKGYGNALGRCTERYSYDSTNNITSMKHIGTNPTNPGWTRAYAYNEKSLIDSSQGSNRLSQTSIGNTIEKYGYNGNDGLHGNITDVPHLSLLRWNAKDQLSVSSRQRVNNGGTPETTYYNYDSAGQRLRKVTERQTAAGVDLTRKSETIYIGLFEIYREFDSSGKVVLLERETLRVKYGGQSVAQIETRTTGTDGNPVQLVRYQFGNHLGSTNLELDDQARIISYEEYSPFGSTYYQAVRSQTEVPKRYRYTDKERDEESGFYYHGARYYMPWLGRWLSSDPSGFVDGLNTYAYTLNNPISLRDPSGTEGQRGEETHEKYKGDFTGTEKPAELQTKLHGMGLEYEGEASWKDNKWSVSHLYHWSAERGRSAKVPLAGGGEPSPDGSSASSGPPPSASDGAGGSGGGSPATGGEGPEGAGGTPGGGSGGPPERNWWTRGGSHVVWGTIGLGLLAAVYFLSNPVGWFSLLAITLGAAASFAGIGAGGAELAASYSGGTTAAQEEKLNEAISTTTLLAGSPVSLVVGMGTLMYTGTDEGLYYGALGGGLLEAGAPLLYGGGRLALREIRFGFPRNMQYERLRPLLREVYGIADAAARRRPNPLFYRGTEYLELSHVFQRSKFAGTWKEYILNRPAFLDPKWGTDHGLLDPYRWQRMRPAWKAVYEGQQIGGVQRGYMLLNPDLQLTLKGVANTAAVGTRAPDGN